MNEQEARVAIIKQTRRSILDTLNATRPACLSYETLCGVFVELDEHYVRRDLEYLVSKGYVEWVNPRRNAPWKERSYGLTSDGMEIADKINTDPALEP